MFVRVTSYFFILYLSERLCFSSVYLKLKASLRCKKLHVPEFFLNDISFKGKAESYIKTIGGIRITERKCKRSV